MIVSLQNTFSNKLKFPFLLLFLTAFSTAAFPQTPVHNVTTGNDYTTIQAAIDAASSNDVIKVDPGTYAERIVVSKRLTIEGPNAGKAGNDPARMAEAVIIPPVTDVSDDGTDGLPVPMVKFLPGSEGSFFDGFEVNGDNPALSGSGVIAGGVSVDAAFGIRMEGAGGVTVQNNVVENLGSTTIAKYGYPYALGISAASTGPVSGITITRNYIKNINQADKTADLDGVMIYGNAYAQVTDNVMDSLRIGVQFVNQYSANGGGTGFPAKVDGNDISAYRAGIYYNNQYGSASPWTVSNNTLRSVTNPTGNAIYEGIRVESIRGTVSGTISGNTIIGNVADRMNEDPNSIVTGISFNNDINTTGTFLVKDNDISDVLDGIVYETDNSAAKLTTDVKYEGGNIHDVQRDYVRYEIAAGMTTPVANVNLPTTQLDGKTGAEYTTAEINNIESQKIIDKEDDPLYGKVNFVFPVEDVTRGTYFATIQDAVDAADPHDEIRVPAGTYAERIVVDKPLTIEGPNLGKAGDDVTRVAEAKIIPPDTKISGEGTGGLQVPVVKFGPGSAGSTFDGFEVNGDNPALPTSGVGVAGTAGISVDAAFGIRVEGVGDITIQNNVVENLGSKPISKFGYPYALGISAESMTPVSGILITRNYIKNMAQADAVADLDAVKIIDNAYARVTDNKIDAVRIGVRFENQGMANPQATTFPAKVGNNDISAYRAGIYYNLQHPNASSWIVSDNTLTSVKNPTGNAIYEGIRVENIEGAVDGTISGNTIIGNVADRIAEDNNSIVTGISFNNNVSTTGTFLVKDNDISDVLDGIVYKTDNSAAKLTTDVKYEGGNIHGVQRDYVRYEIALGTTGVADVNLPGTRLDGKTGGEYTADEVADIESQKIIDSKDNPLYGTVNFIFPVEDVTRGTYFATIQDAVDAADPKDTIKVPAGTYTERVVVDKPLIIEGPNMGKAGDDAARLPEAKIIPPTTDFSSKTPLPLVKFVAGSDGSVFEGFEVNGDNPTLPTSGVVVHGASVDAAFGIRIENTGDVTIENNLVQNFGSNETMPFAVAVSVINTGGKVTSGILVKDNYVKNLNQSPAPAVLDAISLENNAYGQIMDNKIENVREGIRVDNHFVADPDAGSFPAEIKGNDITSYRSGIYANQQKADASPWTVSNNELQSMAGPAGNTRYEGIRVETVTGSVADTISGNIITGNVAARTSGDPSFAVTGISFKNNVSTTGTFTVKNNDISQVVNGIVYTAATGYDLTANIIYAGGNIHDITGDYVHYETAGGTYADINLPSTELDGKTGNEMTAGELETIESKITDKLDNPAFGRVNFIFPVENITRGTFFGTIQGAINAAGTQDGDVINVDTGTYTLAAGIDVTKSVILQGNNLDLTNKPLITGVGGTAHKALFYVRAPNVTIRNFHLQFAEQDAGTPASVTAYGILTGDNGTFNNLTIADNLIEGTATGYVPNSYGIYTGSESGSASDKVTIQRNTIGHTGTGNALGTAIRTWHTYGVIGGSAADKNDLEGFYASIQNGAPGGKGGLVISYNALQGKIEMNEPAAGTDLISDNTITSGGTADAGGETAAQRQPALIEVVSSVTPSAAVVINNNTLNDFRLYGVAVFASNDVRIEGNTFNPLKNSTGFAAVYFDTKTSNTGSMAAQTFRGLKITGNRFNGSGAAGGTGLEFANSNGAAGKVPLTGIVIGGAGVDANTFSGDLGTYINLSNNTGPSDGIDPWKATSEYYSGTATTTAFPFSADIDATGNKFGTVVPATAPDADLYALEAKINHGIDDGVTGFVTVKAKMAFPATAAQTINAFAVAPDENYTVLVKKGTILTNTTLTATKDITLGSEDGSIKLKGITMNGADKTKTLTLAKPVTLSGSLDLEKGVVATTKDNMLTLATHATFSAPVTDAYIDGPVTKVSDGHSFIFPVGDKGVSAPLRIDESNNLTSYTVEYFHTAYKDLTYSSSLTGVSHREYWTFASHGLDPVEVSLGSFDLAASGISDITHVVAAEADPNTGNGFQPLSTKPLSGTDDPLYVGGQLYGLPLLPNMAGIYTFGTTGAQAFTTTAISGIDMPADSLYKAGDLLTFIVHFTTKVTVTGSPVLGFILGTTPVSADKIAAAGDSIVFRYKVEDGDLDNNGFTSADIAGLDPNGGAIQDLAGNDANLNISGVTGGAGVRVDGVAPVITSNGGGSTASVYVAENTTAVTTVQATDADAGTTLTYSLVGGADLDLFSMDGSTGVLEFKTAPDFENPADADGDNNYEVTVRASDGANTVDQAITVTVTDVNDNTPVITSDGGGSTAAINIKEGATAVTTVKATDDDAGTTLTYSLVGGADQGLFSIDGSTGKLVFKIVPDFDSPSDADGDGNYEVTVRASDGVYHADQALTITVTKANDNTPVITSNGGGSTASVYVAENTTAVTTVQATDADAGTTLTYSLVGGMDQGLFSMDGSTGMLVFKTAPDFENPSDADGDNIYEVTVRASDGAHTVDQAITVTVTDVNDNTPVITSDGGGSTAAVNVKEGATAVTTVKATDADAGTTLTYSLVGGADQGLFSIDGSTGKLVFKIVPDFDSPSDADGDGNYEVTVRASDGVYHADQALTITVTKANDYTPVITSDGGGSTASKNVPENTTAVTIVQATDADAGTTLAYSLVGGADQSLFSIDGSTGKLAFKTAPDFENPSDADGDNIYEVMIRVSDGAHTVDQAIAVTVTDVNDNTPVITSDGGGSTAAVNVKEGATAVTTVKATDGDAGTTLTYSLVGGMDQGLFSMNGSTGVLAFKTAPDFENPSDADGDNIYEVTVRASDGAHTVDQAITVTVTDVNDNTPVITSDGGGSTAAINVKEGATAVTTVQATDADAGTTLTYSLVGGADQGLFSIDGSTGKLVFKIAPDFDNPSDADGDGDYEVSVRAFDGAHTADQALTITVTKANDNTPVITSNGGGSTASVYVAENTTAVTTVQATDADAGTTLTYSLVGGADQGLFSMDGSTGVLVFKTAPDFENPSDADGDNIYEVMVRVSDGTHTVDQAITVTVTDVNDNTPVITSDGGGSTASKNVPENTTAVTTVRATDADAGTTLTYSLVGGADQSLFSIDGSTGKLVFKTAPDFENPSDADGDNIYEVMVRVSDGAHTVDQAITVTVTDVNDNTPVITSDGGGSTAAINVKEGATAVTTVKATDADAGTTLTYSLVGGADQGLFSMDGSTGMLAFKTAPDFENPSDADGDNIYEVMVRVSDGAHTVDQAITVTVTDVNDNTPVITSDGGGSTASRNVPENTTAVTTVRATDADAGTTLAYSLSGGADQGLFSMDGSTGVLAFKTAPDYENPSDADGDNNYEVTVRASDGTHSVDQAITVAVTDQNDHAPVITPSQAFTLDENSPHGRVVGTVTVTDADGPTTYRDWTITAGNTDDAFAIDANTGVITVNSGTALDFEKTPTFNLTVTAGDGVHTSDPAVVTISLNNVNDPPTNISLDNTGIYENNSPGALIGKFTSADQDAGSSFSYTLVNGEGDAGNVAFMIEKDQLKAAETFDREKQASYSIRVRTTDNDGLSFDKIFIIAIQDVNEAPTMDVISDETVCSDTGPHDIPVKGISAGPETGQSYSLSIDADKDYFDDLAIKPGNRGKATIHYTLKPGAEGVARLKVSIQDDGGTENGGTDILNRSFSLTVNPLPVISIAADPGSPNPVSKGILMHLTASGADSYQWANGPGIQSGWNDATLAIRPQQDATYTVTGTNVEGCRADKDYALQVVIDYKLICNNIISPNGDGKNDTWIISNIDSYPNNKVMIFDRGGRMIYEKKNYDNQWDGTLNGGKLHEGTYYYVFIVDGGKKVFKGYIELLK